MRVTRLLLVFLLTAYSMAGDGLAAQTVTLAEAVTLAETGDVTREILGLEGQIAAEGVTQAKGQRRPRVGLKLEYVQTQQTIISQDNETFQEGKSVYPVATVTLTVTQPLYDAVRFRELPLARAEEELAAARAEAQLTDVNRQLVAAFIGVAEAQNRVREAALILSVRKEFAADVATMVDSGRSDLDQQMRAESDVFAAEASLVEAEAGMSEALFDLQRFTGVQVGGVWDRGAFSLTDPRSLGNTFSLARLEDMNPDIQIAKAELVVAERQLRQVRGQFQPTAELKLEGEYTQSRGSLFGGGSTVGSVDLGLEVNWSIYEGGVRRSKMRVAQRQVEIAQLRIEQARRMAEARFLALTEALEKAREMIITVGLEQVVSNERAVAAENSLAGGKGRREALLEAGLRRDIASITGRTARMRAAQIQAEIYALFGALDTDALSRDFSGG